MTWQIALVFVLLAATLASFMREKFPPDLTALALLVVLIATRLLPMEKAFSVFANPAPITIGAMFVLSAALVKCGAIDLFFTLIERSAGWYYGVVVGLLVLVVGAISAFVNNTPVVVVFLPVVLGLARRMQLSPSKLLIPLSYAAILGGTCTLIGTSTNLIVNSIAVAKGLPSIRMFELAWLGIPTLLTAAVYLAIVGRRLLPDREMLTSILSSEERREYITEAFVQPGSAVPGKTIAEAGLTHRRGIRVLELVRDGIPISLETPRLRLEAGDRLLLACRPKGIVHTRGIAGVDLISELNVGLEQIAAHEGSIVEGVLAPASELVGRTLRELKFRQRFRMVVLAIHRQGLNLREQLDSTPLRAGDVLLMMGTDPAIQALRAGQDIILFDQAPLPARAMNKRLPLAMAVVGAIIATASLNWVPIELGALAGAVLLCATGCIKPRDAYHAIEWNILFLIFGMLAMGHAMEHTGAAAYVAHNIVSFVNYVVPLDHRAIVMLACIYLVTAVFTEILSNNAVAALMAPIAIGVAVALHVNPQPFVVAVMFAASAAFSTPIGYQTNTYVYGVGGYRFGDFLRIGIPLNVLCFVTAVLVIPRIWPL
ncbi:SLC13 family permease [Opitutus terrae]|uniref:TrkA-C domain protein n=1 Tax=Opitutus terrae (strain DSM 11246 / JCM 15787 / PB90-1) TaxID=452637 RepID=B1ZMS1_OPITP|nr:SLC13 family permease [Opitutus terrae]ACB75349.1 TrkA-C domain protein [Opitutus terrae PB90-1]